jgi:hypothetical protein
MEKALLFVCFVFLALLCSSQQVATLKVAQTTSPVKPPVEKVEGILAVSGYFGGKLLGELKSRFNLSENSEPTVPTTVLVKVGMISFERLENRPVNDN